MLGLYRSTIVALLFSVAGCSAVINPDSDRLGDDPDTGVPPPPPLDSGIDPRDAGPPGDGGSCVEGSTSCAGDALVSCFGGMEVVQDCQAASAFCEAGRCEPWRCVPGTRECAGDGRSVLVCGARGDDTVAQNCGDGFCEPSSITCSGGPPPVCPDSEEIGLNEMHNIDLCAQRDSNTFNRGPGCDTSLRAGSGDAVFVLELDRMTRVTIELTDVDGTRAVDTVVYVRGGCEDPSSQLSCHDDVPCAASTVPGGAFCTGSGGTEVDVRQSRMTLNLPLGRYYIVADAFERRGDGVSYTCGLVRLSVRAS